MEYSRAGRGAFLLRDARCGSPAEAPQERVGASEGAAANGPGAAGGHGGCRYRRGTEAWKRRRHERAARQRASAGRGNGRGIAGPFAAIWTEDSGEAERSSASNASHGAGGARGDGDGGGDSAGLQARLRDDGFRAFLCHAVERRVHRAASPARCPVGLRKAHCRPRCNRRGGDRLDVFIRAEQRGDLGLLVVLGRKAPGRAVRPRVRGVGRTWGCPRHAGGKPPVGARGRRGANRHVGAVLRGRRHEQRRQRADRPERDRRLHGEKQRPSSRVPAHRPPRLGRRRDRQPHRLVADGIRWRLFRNRHELAQRQLRRRPHGSSDERRRIRDRMEHERQRERLLLALVHADARQDADRGCLRRGEQPRRPRRDRERRAGLRGAAPDGCEVSRHGELAGGGHWGERGGGRGQAEHSSAIKSTVAWTAASGGWRRNGAERRLRGGEAD